MNSLVDLYHLEIKNLYAFEKQFNSFISNFESISNKKLSKRVKQISKENEKDFEAIRKSLAKQEINPGNTVDSICSELIENLTEISNSDIATDVKESGLLASLHRLMSYKAANYRTVRRLAKTLGLKKVQKQLKSIRKKSEKRRDQLQAIMKSSLFKDAMKA